MNGLVLPVIGAMGAQVAVAAIGRGIAAAMRKHARKPCDENAEATHKQWVSRYLVALQRVAISGGIGSVTT